MLTKQFLLFLFSFVFCYAQNSVDLSNGESEKNVTEKAYKVVCESNNDKYGTCSYSARFYRLTGGQVCKGTARITINGVGDTFTVDTSDSTGPKIVNFEVYKGDEVVLYFEPNSQSNFSCSYGFYDQPNGSGTAFVTSASTSFQLYNPCSNSTSCTYTLKKTSSGTWPQNSFINITVNNGSPQTFTGTNIQFTVQIGDSILFEFFTVQGTGGMSVEIEDSLFPIFKWFQGGYFSPMTFINPCTKVPYPPSPFGGNFYPITDQQIENFLNDISSPSIWLPITYDDNE